MCLRVAGIDDPRQNMWPPIGTSRSGCRRTTSPLGSGTPSVSTSDKKGPIWRTGKLTTADDLTADEVLRACSTS